LDYNSLRRFYYLFSGGEMRQNIIKIVGLLALVGVFILSIVQTRALANNPAQQPTVAIATVTSTPSGPMAVVVPGPEPQINLRSGPNTTYDLVGVLLIGQKVPAKGRSPGGSWIMVEYPGIPGGVAWVWSAYVRIDPPVDLPIVEPPPTPTPAVTNTIDPTLAAKFVVTLAPTRLATYTPPPPLNIPTFEVSNGAVVGNIPMGLIIVGLAALGLIFGVLSFAGRR
jgi:hypothetical protein